MKLNPFLFYGIAIAFSFSSSTTVLADKPHGPSLPVKKEADHGAYNVLGVWEKSPGLPRYEIFECGTTRCGKIVYLNHPIDPETGKPIKDKNNPDASKRSQPLLGTRILLDMSEIGPNKYKGKIYDPVGGRVYSGTLTQLNVDSIKLSGCVLGGLICKSDTLIRAQ